MEQILVFVMWKDQVTVGTVPIAPNTATTNRVKPEDTLVEARSGSDVQIDCQIWAWGRKVLKSSDPRKEQGRFRLSNDR